MTPALICRRQFAAGIALLGAACGVPGSPASAGDAEYLRGRYEAAAIAYARAADSAARDGLTARRAAAQWHAGQLGDAVASYRALAAEDPTRADEAAEGLGHVLRAAERAGDAAASRAAILALRDVAPGRPLAASAGALLRSAPDPVLLTTVGLAAAASADDRASADSMLLVVSAAHEAAGHCERAVPLAEALLRRRAAATALEPARARVMRCATRLGRAALAAGAGGEALAWLARALAAEPGPAARPVELALGDALLLTGDTLGALVTYSRLAGTPDADSTARQAEQRIARLKLQGGAAPVP